MKNLQSNLSTLLFLAEERSEMTSIIPITLVGENLGQRHRYFNCLVNEALKQNENFEAIKKLPEQSPLDRLFKINIALKARNVDYIIQNLKDDHILYVSKALKSKWLIEREDIINPQYLEEHLYPVMIMTAVSKMKHWVYINLKDQKRCKDFYEYYAEKNFKLAMKFFMKCSKKFIENEFLNLVTKINPSILKILCETCPNVAKIFFDVFSNDEKVKRQYLDKQKEYFAILKYILKINPDFVLDMYETYFNKDLFQTFSKSATKYIMSYHKNRFLQKPELYTAYLLHMTTLAECLTSEECEELVIKLARAKYLHCGDWFNYKRVEPFIKRLKLERRAEFKKQVFVRKDIGEAVEKWPYQRPSAPKCDQYETNTIFDDRQYEPRMYEPIKKRKIMKKKGNPHEYCEIVSMNQKTLLDKLFDEFRFVSFGQTLYELRKRIPAESSNKNREYMMLVLVSKAGGKPDNVASLLQLLAQHSNEPSNVRATIIRSLVKRAQAWRLPEKSWNQLLKFGQGLGLDGNPSEADCDEGLHAVVIRSLILNGKCEPEVQKQFLSNFSDFTRYSLSSTEMKTISELLPKMLLSVAKENEDMRVAIHWIDKLIDTLHAYKINLETFPDLLDTICELADRDNNSHTTCLLIKLYESKVARRKLFRWTFELIKTDASYLNSLIHDPSVIKVKYFIECYIGNFMSLPEQFLKKLSLYFSEEGGLASIFLQELKKTAIENFPKMFGRPIAILSGSKLEPYLHELDASDGKIAHVLAASVRANAHMTCPLLDIDKLTWKKAGVKMIANRLLICRAKEIDTKIVKLLKWKRTIRVALALSKRTAYETDIFLKIAQMKPKLAIKAGLKLMKLYSENVDIRIWETIKPMIQGTGLSSDKIEEFFFRRIASLIKFMPLKIRPDYSFVVYSLLIDHSMSKAMPPLCYVEKYLPDINEQCIDDLLQKFLTEHFDVMKISAEDKLSLFTCLYIRILVKFLLLCKNEEVQTTRWKKIGELFLARMEDIYKSNDHGKVFSIYLDEALATLVYNRVFLDSQYVSILPVIVNILNWLKNILPLDKHFDMYVNIHLTMLYFKAVRQGVQQFPEIFGDERKTRKEGVEVVGRALGRYIVKEVKTLRETYFDTITELYTKALIEFLENHNQNSISSECLSSILRGILSENFARESLVVIHLMAAKKSCLKNEHYSGLFSKVNEIRDPILQSVVHAEL